jgi:hypothetical protein
VLTRRSPPPRRQERARQDHVDVRVGGDVCQVRHLRKAGGRQRGTHDQRFERGNGIGDGVREAERQEFDLGVRPQQSKRQDHDARHGPRSARIVRLPSKRRGSQIVSHRGSAAIAVFRRLRERAMDHAIDRGDCR